MGYIWLYIALEIEPENSENCLLFTSLKVIETGNGEPCYNPSTQKIEAQE